MILQEILDLDNKGILAWNTDTQDSLIRRADTLSETYARLNTDSLARRIECLDPDIKVTGIVPEHEIKPVIEKIKRQYRIDVSWIPAFLVKIPNGISGRALSNYTVDDEDREVRYKLPPCIVVNPLSLHHSIKTILAHELIHAVRVNTDERYLDLGSRYVSAHDFEEATASERFQSFISENQRPLQEARCKLDQEFGRDWGYVFMRLTHAEIHENLIEEGSKGVITPHLKNCSRNYLRYRVILEKLGI